MAEGIVLPDNVSDVNANFVESTFTFATNHLNAIVCSCPFEKNNVMIESWTVAKLIILHTTCLHNETWKCKSVGEPPALINSETNILSIVSLNDAQKQTR